MLRQRAEEAKIIITSVLRKEYNRNHMNAKRIQRPFESREKCIECERDRLICLFCLWAIFPVCHTCDHLYRAFNKQYLLRTLRNECMACRACVNKLFARFIIVLLMVSNVISKIKIILTNRFGTLCELTGVG